MNKRRRFLFFLADICDMMQKKLRGAANRISPELLLTQFECERQNWRNVRPCFVLSTGRCGTLLLNRLLLFSPDAYAVHHPEPELVRPSKFAYEKIKSHPEIFAQILKACREELVFRAAQRGKVYIETNNRITFFAPAIQSVFPQAVYIHLVRHPGEFVRSGIRRQWYSGSNAHDLGRITPVSAQELDDWKNFTHIEKIGWLWNETNKFIENFTAKLESSRYIFIKAENLFLDPSITKIIYEFCRLQGFNEDKIRRFLKKPVNKQKKGDFPEYKDWTDSQREQLYKSAPLMLKYGYHGS
ncbi:sulfotransferase [candidate division KSB1 bacterium]|nr:sulfotransferase [candidate division KSB1 bacterium]